MPPIEPVLIAYDTQREIAQAMVNGIRNKLGMTKDQCYLSIAPMFIDGQNPEVLQVCTGSAQKYGGGDGAQQGGAILTKCFYTLTYWYKLKLDMHGRSEQVLIEGADNVLTMFAKLRTIFAQTNLGMTLYEMVLWEGETATNWYDIDEGVLRRDMTLSAPYGYDTPSFQTLTAEDVRGDIES